MATSETRSALPLVYACSGFSSVAQLANTIAIELDREGQAEMSCIAGVGADVPLMIRVARSGRAIIALDGCPIRCVARCLGRHGVEPTRHHVFSDYGLDKERGELDEEAAELVRHKVRAAIP